MRKPSYLISCSQSSLTGGVSTWTGSSGLMNFSRSLALRMHNTPTAIQAVRSRQVPGILAKLYVGAVMALADDSGRLIDSASRLQRPSGNFDTETSSSSSLIPAW